jgi:hypothetical protein
LAPTQESGVRCKACGVPITALGLFYNDFCSLECRRQARGRPQPRAYSPQPGADRAAGEH